MDITIFGVVTPFSKIINSMGLVFDITGAWLIFKYGLPEDVRRRGQSYLLLETTDQDQVEKAKLYDHRSRRGLWLLIGGFAAQLASNFL